MDGVEAAVVSWPTSFSRPPYWLSMLLLIKLLAQGVCRCSEAQPLPPLRRSIQRDKDDFRQSLKVCIRRDELRTGVEGCGINHRVGHCQVAIQANPSREQGQSFVDGDYAGTKRRGEKSVGGGRTPGG